jgi:hypothetical protein
MLRQGLRTVWEPQKACEPLHPGHELWKCGVYYTSHCTLAPEGRFRHNLIDPDAGVYRRDQVVALNFSG